jgi:anti-sigma factor RsiW
MSDLGRPISEDDLHAYVDHLLEDDRIPVVERHLRENQDVAAKIAAYSAQRDALRAAFATEALEPVPSRLNPYLIRQRMTSRRNAWRAAAAVVLAFGVGGSGGWFLHGRLTPANSMITVLVEEAVANHVVYTADRRRPTELGAEQRDDMARWASNRLNRPVAPPDLTLAGYRYMGGRLAATSHGPAGMFMYQNEQGVRLTVFVRPVTNGGTQPLETVGAGPLEGCAWIAKGVGYTVVAPIPANELEQVATRVQRLVESAT